MPAPAKSKAVATVKLNEIEDVKESQPASPSASQAFAAGEQGENEKFERRFFRYRYDTCYRKRSLTGEKSGTSLFYRERSATWSHEGQAWLSSLDAASVLQWSRMRQRAVVSIMHIVIVG